MILRSREKSITIFAGILGAIHCVIGFLQQSLTAFPVVGIDADADTCAQGMLLPIDGYGACRFIEELLRDIGDMTAVIQVFDKNIKLVTAHAGDGVGMAKAVAHPSGNLAQHQVTGVMTKRVIDFLELVEIDEENSELATGALAMP